MPESGPVRTRIAPTPSGYLHLGNAWNFLLTWLLARSQGGTIHLRIDDMDVARFRQEYLEDIFASLAWLGLDWDTGPANSADFHANYSQRLRRASYRSALVKLMELNSEFGPSVYACRCSREQVKQASHAAGQPGIYPGTCRNLGLPRNRAEIWQSGKGLEHSDNTTVLRLKVVADATVEWVDEAMGPVLLHPGQDMGDFIVWQRNGEPAYQLTSMVDDEALGINWIVRGRDLLPSTGAQIYLARCMGNGPFPWAHFVHHGLIRGPDGKKLSKSTGTPLKSEAVLLHKLRVLPGGRAALYRFFAQALKLNGDCQTPADILAQFHPGRFLEADLDCERFLKKLREEQAEADPA